MQGGSQPIATWVMHSRQVRPSFLPARPTWQKESRKQASTNNCDKSLSARIMYIMGSLRRVLRIRVSWRLLCSHLLHGPPATSGGACQEDACIERPRKT